MEYRVAYYVLPAGVGPDDYELDDLERREDTVELPEPADGYGPPMSDVQDALRPKVSGGTPVAIRFLD